ncbi:FprA family A-type flavoprotein [Butyrivibrio fibrisolvens]|uniref:FprA family A-type flavoprotein n=1 Tax=Butyrivibrio fibrisolvens TaxID=831 RepID=UPI00041371CD|nr:FprA family A-type flavoprotein [Butyrivibrio fibrisolvens]
MINIKNVTDDILWIGGSDRRLALFENLFPLPDGVSYNSYVVKDDKTIIFDTVDVTIADQYVENLQAALAGAKPDYLVILHMEPDHCSQISRVVSLYPDIQLVGGVQTFKFLHQFFPELDDAKKVTVKEGDTLDTGSHSFSFVAAPMVHWPEVLLAFDTKTGTLFSADAFGTFGSVDSGIFADEYNFEKDFLDDARRYYANIVGKYGAQVQAVLKKAQGLSIERICPLHGPIWRKDLGWFIDKYDKWSQCIPETEDILIVYGSMYGHTASAAETLAGLVHEIGGKKVRVFDVSKTDKSFLVGEAWRCGKIVLMAPTYNGGLYLPMESFIEDLVALGLKNRKFALGQNGTWAPVAAKHMSDKLALLKDCTILEDVLTITSALHESDLDTVKNFAKAIADMA